MMVSMLRNLLTSDKCHLDSKGSSMVVSMLRTLLTLDKCHLDSMSSTDDGIFLLQWMSNNVHAGKAVNPAYVTTTLLLFVAFAIIWVC